MFKKRPCRWREKQSFGAAVVRIGSAFDQATLGQLVEQSGQGDGLQVEHLGELGLVEALGAVEPHQNGPLGPGHTKLRRLVVCIGPQQARYITDNEAEFSARGIFYHCQSFQMCASLI